MSLAEPLTTGLSALARRAESPLRALVQDAVGDLGKDLGIFTSSAAQRTSEVATKAASDPRWYQDSVIYEVRLGSFKDSNGDGIGDFKGLTSKLDYLKKLGVDTLWVLPHYPSPLKDDGYDIADYFSVNPAYGTMADFKKFVDEAHKRDMKVVTELVVNHTSDQHPWFQRAIKAPKGSPERDWYIWSDTPDKYKGVRVIFKDAEKSNWAWNDQAQAYYYHRFFSAQPDLNYDNPAVKSAVFDVVDHWLGQGVDGLRLDAVQYLYKREGTSGDNLPETHAFLKELRQHVEARFPGRMLLAEASTTPDKTLAYFGEAAGTTNDECHMAFNFPLLPRLYQSLAEGNRNAVQKVLEETPKLPQGAQWANFLRSHDTLSLSKVPEAERQPLLDTYASEPGAILSGGIRRRLAPMLGGDRRKIELLDKTLLSLPGTPVLYYGDEIGMGDNLALADRNGLRTPMQWTGGRNAGFSSAPEAKLPIPLVDAPGYDPATTNVKSEARQPDSLLNWTTKALAVRKKVAAVFGRGDLQTLTPSNDKVLAYVRSYQGRDVLVVSNLSDSVESTDLALQGYKGKTPRDLWTGSALPKIGPSPYRMTLAPYESYWLELG